MDRSHVYRGKKVGEDAWVYGSFWKSCDGSTRILNESGIHLVSAKSVGEWTGLLDVDGKKIFEGDVIWSNGGPEPYVVEWSDACAGYVATEISRYSPSGEASKDKSDPWLAGGLVKLWIISDARVIGQIF